MMPRLRCWLWLTLLPLAGCGSRDGDAARPLMLFTAASTKESAEQIAADFQAETGVRVLVSPGPSSGLAKQIERGADADVFLSADEALADYLASKGLVAERRDLLTNRLVVVVPAAGGPNLKGLGDLAGDAVKRLALAEAGVPAGEYARQALNKAAVLDQVKGKVVGGTDVRATLQFVRRGEAEAGIVYATDVLVDSAVRVALEIDTSLHDPIRYPLVLLQREAPHSAARPFYDYLSSAKAAEVFRRAGFGVMP
jgi:molybdate transport system substrate-binding protein